MERKEPSWLSTWFQFIHLFLEYEIFFYLETMERFPLASDACLCFMKTAAAVKPFWPSWQCLPSSSSSPLGLSWNKRWREKGHQMTFFNNKTNVVCLVSICYIMGDTFRKYTSSLNCLLFAENKCGKKGNNILQHIFPTAHRTVFHATQKKYLTIVESKEIWPQGFWNKQDHFFGLELFLARIKKHAKN